MFRFGKYTSSKRTLPIVFLFLLGSVLVVFWPALENGFVDWDDNNYILANKLIRSLSPSNLFAMLTSLTPVYWQPVTWLSHAIDYYFFGLNPSGHHLVSIILHGLNAFLVFLLIRYFVGRACPAKKENPAVLWVSVWVALLFAVHPLRVESVVWAAERKDLLCAFFMFSALLAYIRYVDAGTERGQRKHYWWMLGLFLLALMSKPMAVTLPVVLLLLDVYPFNRIDNIKSFLKRVWEKAPLFVMSLVCGIFTIIGQKLSGAVVPVEHLNIDRRVFNAMQSSVFYIEKTLWPHPVVPFYPFPKYDERLWVELIAFFLICGFCVLKWRDGKKYWAVTWMYFLITVAPVIGIMQVGGQGAADRFTYIPTLSFFILFAVGVVYLIQELYSRRRGVAASLLVGGLALSSLGAASILTVRQIPVWHDTGVFWETVIGHFPDEVARAHANLGLYYQKQGNQDRAMVLFRQAMEIHPGYAPPFNYLGLIHMEREEYDKVEPLFLLALSIEQSPLNQNNLGLLYFKKNNLPKAEELLHKALRSDPDFFQAHNNLGLLAQTREEWGQAQTHFQRALEINFDFAPAHANLGNLYRKQKKIELAITEFNLAIFLDSENAEFHHALALVYMGNGYLEQAHSELEETLRLNPDHPHARNNLELVRQHYVPKT